MFVFSFVVWKQGKFDSTQKAHRKLLGRGDSGKGGKFKGEKTMFKPGIKLIFQALKYLFSSEL